MPRRKRKSAGCLGANRLTGRCRGELHGLRHIMHCEGLSHLPDTQGNTDTRCFCHLNKDVGPNKSGKSFGRDLKTVMAWRQARNIERSRASTFPPPFPFTPLPPRPTPACPSNSTPLLVPT